MSAILDLEEQISALKQGDHVCMVYENHDEQMAAAVPFILQGLQRNEQCVYIADDQTISEVSDRLRKAGLKIQDSISSGALSLLTEREAYLSSGCFSPLGMVELLRDTVEASVNEGYDGFRVTGEMTWALGAECGCDRLIEYEARLNTFFPTSRSLAVCQYNRQRFEPSIIQDVLRTHPRAIIGDQVCPNVYYEPPELILEKPDPARKVDWMMQQLRRTHDTERKLKRFNVELEKAVREKTASLHEARAQLETFCYSIAHDLRAPLRAIKNFSVVLVEDHGAALDPTGRDLAQRMHVAADKMQRMMDDLLQFSRIDREEVSLETVSLRPVFVEVCEEIQAEEPDRKIQFKIAEKFSSVQAIPPVLRVAVHNLLANAVKYVDAGKTPEVEIWSEQTAETVRINIRDNGIGIALRHHEKIFNVFERLYNNAFSGTGMGLAIVRKAIQRMGGRVGVISEEGKGSTFWIDLPSAV